NPKLSFTARPIMRPNLLVYFCLVVAATASPAKESQASVSDVPTPTIRMPWRYPREGLPPQLIGEEPDEAYLGTAEWCKLNGPKHEGSEEACLAAREKTSTPVKEDDVVFHDRLPWQRKP
ncbi:hypothetical protein ETB97_000952, partial [Aspergillus alliaceus]